MPIPSAYLNFVLYISVYLGKNRCEDLPYYTHGNTLSVQNDSSYKTFH